MVVHRKNSLSFFLTVIGGLFIGLIFTYPSQNPHPIFPVPKISEIYLPGPLTIAQPNTTVLGAQTIDPLDLINSINLERVKANSPSLRISQVLMKAAQMRADTIIKHQNFSHQDPFEGIELLTVLPKVNYHFQYASENIGMGGISGPDFVNGFMHSASHRENLLNPKLTDTGAGVVSGPYHQYYVNIAVQLFAIPGGEEESLGYSKKEIDNYRNELNYLNNQLSPIKWFIGKNIAGNYYSDTKHQQLTREQEIVQVILVRMQKNEPLTTNEALLIVEYNRLNQNKS